MGDLELGAMRELLVRRDDELRREWSRSLPFGDALDDRWERARRLGFGEGASVYDSCAVFGDVAVGSNTWIGPFTVLDGSGDGLTIGEWCSISAGVMIYTHDSVARALTGGKAPVRREATRIGNRCYIGSQCVLAAGTVLGDECVVAAQSYVHGAFPHRSILGGCPARVLGSVVVNGDDVELRFDDRHSSQGQE